ncbi:hypothetical protein [Micropruina sp.]|uniref:hypothetical protein n=1 Tax=Micropruina sp. TaxID=2737536 RepID=UPI00260E5B95|nr:hypothetical protein [Micropruina sp.]
MRTERPWPRVERSVSTGYVPPGWPERVRPPGAPDWELTATEFLLDCCPADYRRYRLLRRHPVVLARFAAVFVEAQERASREGLAGVRMSLADLVAPEVIAGAVEVWSQQQAFLARLRREVTMVEEALRGRRFVPTM